MLFVDALFATGLPGLIVRWIPILYQLLHDLDTALYCATQIQISCFQLERIQDQFNG
jgi:hypothetical protein